MASKTLLVSSQFGGQRVVRKPSHRAIRSHRGQADTVDVPLTVSLEVPAGPIALPRTGTSADLLVAIALLVLVCGALLVRVAR
jgi:LPXTG-motif cell wall-anchored protein